MRKQKQQIQLLSEGFVACPSCNLDDKIQLVSVSTDVDPEVDSTGELQNIYLVLTLRCQHCSTTFDVERVDVRFGIRRGE